VTGTPLVSCVSPLPHDAEKFAVTFAEVIVTELDAGVNVQPDLLGVTVYVPAAKPDIE
jgi:hypothetical protein